MNDIRITGKKVEAETYLPVSSFTGTEITRVKKNVGGIWKNFFTKFDDLKTWITTAIGNYVVSVVPGNAITVDASDPQNPIINALTPPLQDGLISGGRVTWIVDYDYEVSAATYVIGGVLYSSPLTQLTLTPSDPVLDRLDTFILDNTGTASFITGTPSAPPVLEPDVDVTTQLRIAFALVEAASTQPTLPTEDIYLENTEWVTADNTANIDLASPNFPYAGTVDIEGTNVANGNFITFTPTLFPSLILLDSLVFKIRSKAAWNAPSRLAFQFRNGTTNIGNTVNLGNALYGFVSATTGVYQNINIPLSDFGNIAAATNLRIIKTGAGTIGFYLDNIQLVGENNVVQLPQVQPDWASGVAPAAILNKSVTRTVAQMQALATAGQLDPNMWYVISDAVSSFGEVRVRARNTSNLEKHATLIKGGISYAVEYSLDDGGGNDSFTYLHDDLNNNITFEYFGDTFIPLIPFDGTWNNNLIHTSGGQTVSDAAKIAMGSTVITAGSTINLNDNGSPDVAPIQIINVILDSASSLTMTAKAAGGAISVSGCRVANGSQLIVTSTASATSSVISEASSASIDANDSNSGTTAIASCLINGGSILQVKGISGGVGTNLNGCAISGLNGDSVLIQGGETYNSKFLNKSTSTFDGNRTITADGAFSFIDSDLVASYNRSFIGIWTITAAAPHDVTSFTDRTTSFGHTVTFILDSGSSAISFLDSGADIIMKGGVDAVLASEGDYVTFRFVGQVGYEVDRGIY